MKKVILSAAAPAPIGPYSQAIESQGFIFCSGQIPLTADGGQITGSISEQAEKKIKNIDAVLKAAKTVSFETAISLDVVNVFIIRF